LTLACLASIVGESEAHAYEVIVVDNASTDGSAAAIQAAYGEDSRFHVIGSEENLGFAQANNLAAKEARGEYLLLLNPDTVVLDHAVDRLLDFAQSKPDNKIWGGRTIFADGSLNPTSCAGPYSLWSVFTAQSGLRAIFPRSRWFDPRTFGKWPHDTVREVAIVTGCLLLIERSFWETLGGFDPAFFMYGEEADLCLRAAALGAQPIVTPAASIVHHGGASEKMREDKVVRLLGAETRLYRRHMASPKASLAIAMTLGGTWLRSTLYSLFGRRPNEWRAIWRRRSEWR
jgi:GT2 family glycosyltransferase